MRILITGSEGFIGKNLTNYFKKNHKVIEFDLSKKKDLLNDSQLKRALKGVDAVFHLAAVGDVYLAASNPKLAASVGVAGTANLVKLANEVGNVKKIIYASTWEVYGDPEYLPLDEKHPCNPDHPYSISKYGGELMIRSKLNDVPWIILRLGSAYGPNMRPNAVIPLFISKAKNGQDIKVDGDGKQTRQFTHTKDIAAAFNASLKSSLRNEIFNIISTETQSIRDITIYINKQIPVKVTFGPKRKADVIPANVSAKKATNKLCWKANVKFKDGIRDLIKS